MFNMTAEEVDKAYYGADIQITEDDRYHLVPNAKKVKGQPPKPGVAIIDYRMPEGKDTFEFDTVEEAFKFKMADGRTVGEVIETWEALPEYPLDADTIFFYKKK